jgi:hypothetical protein
MDCLLDRGSEDDQDRWRKRRSQSRLLESSLSLSAASFRADWELGPLQKRSLLFSQALGPFTFLPSHPIVLDGRCPISRQSPDTLV